MRSLFIFPFLVLLIAQSPPCALEEVNPNSYISIKLAEGKNDFEMFSGYPIPPDCKKYDECGTINWNFMNYIQFLQPENSLYPLKCAMRADNLKNEKNRSPIPIFEVIEKNSANTLTYLFYINRQIEKHMNAYNLSIACSNGAHRCCTLGQQHAWLKNGRSRSHEDFPLVILNHKVRIPDLGKNMPSSFATQKMPSSQQRTKVETRFTNEKKKENEQENAKKRASWKEACEICRAGSLKTRKTKQIKLIPLTI